MEKIVSLCGNITAERAVEKIWDVAVVGAGPAGAFAAHQVAVAGWQVLLIEKQRFPRYKVCGCCLSARAVAVLQAAGLAHLFDLAGAQTLHGFALASKGHHIRLALPEGKAVSRAAFDAALTRAALAAGARFLPECRAVLGNVGRGHRKLILHHARGVCEIRAKVVIGADGLAGTLRKNFNALAAQPKPASYLGAGTMAAAALSFYQPGTIYMAHGRFGYAGLVRVENAQLVIAAALAASFVKQAGTLAHAVAKVLCEAGFPPPPDLYNLPWQGTPALTRRAARISAERFFALGDAAAYVEPFTGEGITWAISAAAALAPLVQRGAAEWSPQLEYEWARLHRQLVGKRQRSCRLIAWALRRPALIATIVRLAEKKWLSLEPLANYFHLETGRKPRRIFAV
jgi:flavin-dependent dehydrogenase